jgi:DNA-binding CsgD family transcriptional regulator
MGERKRHSWYFALFGLCFVWSPTFGTLESTVFGQLTAYPDELFMSRIVLLSSFGFSCLMLAVVGRGITSLSANRPIVWLAGSVMAAGMLAGSLPAFGVNVGVAFFIGAVLRGSAAAVIFLAWLENISTLDSRSVGIMLFAALALYAAMGVLIPLVAQTFDIAALLLLVACPLISCWGCVQVSKQEPAPRHTKPGSQPMTSFGMLLFVGSNFLYGFVFGILLDYYAVLGNPPLYAVFGLVSLVAAVLFFAVRKTVDLSISFRIFSFLAVSLLAVAVLLFQDIPFVVAAVAAGIWAIQIFFTIVIFVDAELSLPGTTSFVGGLAFFVATLGLLCAAILIPPAQAGSLSELPLVIATFVAVLYLSVVFLPSGRSWVRSWGFSSFVRAETQEMLIMRRCGEVTAQYGLTPREFEILELLAQNYQKDDISEVLFISPYTTKTHIRNIYTKLEVHSQQELMHLIRHET